jgi:hypothetical protein
VLVAEPLPAGAAPALGRPVLAAAGTMLLLPSAWFSLALAEAMGPDTILVGRRSLVVPGGMVSPVTAGLLDRAVEWLESLGGFGPERAEIDLLRGPSAELPSGVEPRFDLVSAERVSGLFSGAVEVSVRAGAGPVDRLSLRVRQKLPAARPGVRAGDPVLVVLRRGVVRIEMEGKATSSAAVGAPVSAWVTDGSRSFTGVVGGDSAASQRERVVYVDAF